MSEVTLTQAPVHIRMGSSIGQPLTRREGVLKTTGAARYAADHHPPGMVYAALAVSRVARVDSADSSSLSAVVCAVTTVV